jgi:poly(A) polymerase
MTARPMTETSILTALPPDRVEVVARLADAFAAAGEELYLVGGVVRDLLMPALADLERPLPADLDFATSASPETTARLGMEAGAAASYDVGARFGTIGFVFGQAPDAVNAEITTYRREHYPDESRKPAVQLGGTLAEDLSRRDFTVNAIAADARTGEVVDPFGGQADIVMSVIRAVGAPLSAPDERFREDPLRLLRAARFVAQLGFRIDPATAEAMARLAPELSRISKERIYAELVKLLCGRWAHEGLEALAATGLLPVALPELVPMAELTEGRGRSAREKDLWEHTKEVVRKAPDRPVVRWAALLHDAGKPQTRSLDPETEEVRFIGHERVGANLAGKLLRRLKADKTTEQAVAKLVELHSRPETYEPDWTDSAVRRLALEAGDVLPDLLDLAAADVTSAREFKQKQAAQRVAALRAHIERLEAERALSEIKSPLDGDELMALFDLPPGPWIKPIKHQLRELVIDGLLEPDDKAAAERIAREMIEAEKGSQAVGM